MTTFVLIEDVCLEDIHKPMNIPAALCQDVCVGRNAMWPRYKNYISNLTQGVIHIIC